MEIEDVVNRLNKKKTFKVIAFLILSFPTFQNYGQMQSLLLAIFTPNHTCAYKSTSINESIIINQCFVKTNKSIEKCNKWNFSNEPIGKTMMSDYSLVCDKRNYGDLVLVMWYLTTFTAILMGWLSDKYGRKLIACLNLCIETIASICLAFAPDIATNIVFRLFIGISSCSIFITFVWLIESVNIEFRNIVGSFFWGYGCLAYMLYPLIVYGTRNWRLTQLFSTIPNILYLLIFFFPESPRWLLVVGKRKQAFKSLQSICNINKIKFDLEDKDIVAKEDPNGEFLSACRSSVFISRSLLTMLLQFSTGLIYMGVTVDLSILSNNLFLSTFLQGVMETPGLFLSYFSLRYLPRKMSLIIFGTTGSCLMWISVFFVRTIRWQSIIRILIGCLAKAIIASTNQSAIVYVSELFPTSHRSTGFVFVQFAAMFSLIGAIYINKLSTVLFCLPMTIYLFFVLLSLFLTFKLLPETKDLPFPETLADQSALVIGHEKEYYNYMKYKEMK